jgi:adenylosuccinate lyase
MAYRDDVDALAARATALGFEVAAKAEEVQRAAALLEEARARAKRTGAGRR